jgi:hypothetical protein
MTTLIVFLALFGLLAAGSVIVGMIVAGWIGRRQSPRRSSEDGSPSQPPASPEDRA